MSELYKRDIPWVLIVVTAAIFFADYFIPFPIVTSAADQISEWAVIISNFALGIGLYNLVLQNVNTFRRRVPKRWYHSAYFLVLIVISFIAAFTPPWAASSSWNWMLDNMFYSCSAGIYALFGYYFWSAAFRGIRVRKPLVETSLFAIGTITMLLVNSPLGELIFPFLGPVGSWMLNVVGSSVSRAITIGVAIATLAWAMRVLSRAELVGFE